MARSNAATPEDYLAELDPARSAEISRLRDLVNASLQAGYVERMAWGMISWEVPLEVSGRTYNARPLVYAALAAQKNHNALYLNCTYASPQAAEKLRTAALAAGKTLDMGKSCIRFRRADDLPLEAVAQEIGSTTPAEFAAIAAAAERR
jgi:hypothetical protein